MSALWRQAGLNYIQFSAICARIVRQCLQSQYRTEAFKRNESFIKLTRWESGKPIKKE